MCGQREEAESKVDKLIKSMDRLSAALEGMAQAGVVRGLDIKVSSVPARDERTRFMVPTVRAEARI